jgi:hypothetical protein
VCVREREREREMKVQERGGGDERRLNGPKRKFGKYRKLKRPTISVKKIMNEKKIKISCFFIIDNFQYGLSKKEILGKDFTQTAC